MTRPRGLIARRSGRCPVCGRYLVAGRSPVRRLSRAIRPQHALYQRDVRVGTVQDTRPRVWVHARCWSAGEAIAKSRTAA